MNNFIDLATFSTVPIVNEYFKDQEMMYHNSEITVGIEKFAKWLIDNGKMPLYGVKITVNGIEHESAINKVTYQDICILAYGKVINGLTCTWSGKSGKGGHLSWNDTGYPLTIKSGTHFTIINTGNA